jgi:diguanylate cyclase (GGDEF)-like protein
MIVDDAPELARSLAELLQTVGFPDVQVANSAEEAFRRLGLDRDAQDPPVDAILMDIAMPGVNGIEACRRLKAHETLRDVPVIMVAGQTDEHHLEEAFAAGATDYVTKPVKAVELVARLNAALALKAELDQRRARERDLLRVTQQLQEANRALQQLSTLDGLTGIANRRAFDSFLADEWKQAVRDRHDLALILIDIDHFKAFNDGYGHQEGDECLRSVARVLHDGVKRSTDLVARYGGEEFAVVLPHTERGAAVRIAEQLRAAVEGLGMPNTHAPSGRVTISAGVGHVWPRRQDEPARLVRAADEALYQAKAEGRNRVRAAPADAPTHQGEP